MVTISDNSNNDSGPVTPNFKEIQDIWDGTVFDSMFHEWWKCLQDRSTAMALARANTSGIPFYIIQPQIVEVIFRISCKLNQEPSVRYLAVELFDKFVGNHFKLLYDSVWKRKANKPVKLCEERWIRVVRRLKSQALLRILSCIQLASKFVSNTHAVTIGAVVDCLHQFNLKYSSYSVKTSERRVYNTVKCNIPVYDTLNYIEHLIGSLNGIVSDCDVLYNTSIKVLDVTTAMHHQIYRRLFHMMMSKWEETEKEREDFMKLQCDNIHVSCAVVAAAAMICDSFKDAVLVKLSLMSGLPVPDIEGIAAIIIDTIMVT